MLPLDRILSYYIYIVWILIALVCLALVLLIPLWIIVSPILLLAGLVIYTISITPYVPFIKLIEVWKCTTQSLSPILRLAILQKPIPQENPLAIHL
jgi:hypothetical protein